MFAIPVISAEHMEKKNFIDLDAHNALWKPTTLHSTFWKTTFNA